MDTTTPQDTTAVALANPTPQVPPEVLEQVLIGGDLAQLTEAQRLAYYRAVCQSLGLNPLSKPFEYLWLNGKLWLYALRDCADQLRRLHGISISYGQITQNWAPLTESRAASPAASAVFATARVPQR